MTELPPMYPLEEIAEKYDIPLISLVRRARRKEFTHIKIGGKRYMQDDHVRAFLRGQTVKQETPETQRDRDLAATRDRVSRRHSRQKAAA